jgi:uncharacterized protein (TIGR02246 family)
MRSATLFRIVATSGILLLAGSMTAPDLGMSNRQARAGGLAGPQGQPAAPDARAADRAAIRAVLESFLKAFESRDPKALAAHWTAEGEYRAVGGESARGREAIQKGFVAFFARTPEVKAELKPDSLRFLSSGTAIEEGSVTVRRGPTEPSTRADYSALFVREDGTWRLAQLSETPEEEATIEDLAWLVGEWKSAAGQGAEIRTTYSWAPSKKFLHAQFTVKEKDRTFTGEQVIGVAPASSALHSWTFEADGGVGEAEWRRDGDHWILDVSATQADGRTLTETNILRKVNDDTVTWQSINRSLEDSELADLAPVKVTRIKPAH